MWHWCWLIGHRFIYIGNRNITGRPLFYCQRCLKRRIGD